MKLPLSKQAKNITILTALLLGVTLVIPQAGRAQIWEPEGINMPGLWNSWTNPPVNNLALASYTQVPGGRVTKITSGTPRWQTTFSVDATGGDIIGGAYPFLFTSGPSGSPWQNTWKDVNVVMNTLQDYSYNGALDNNITVVNGKWYTANWQDNGYSPSRAIFMETSANPVSINAVTQSPLPGAVVPGQSVTVSITLSGAPCPEELFYVRYSNTGFTTSSLIPIIVTGTSGSGVIPALTGTVSYYVFSTVVANPTADFDMYSIRNNNNGGANYTYSYSTTTVDVTFKVDMAGQVVSADGVFIVGDFQGWNSTATPMSLSGGSLYSVTVPVPDGSYQEYKFLNGNTYAGEETVPAECGADNGLGGFNRYLLVPATDTLLGEVCFSGCGPCPDFISVTFQVEMAEQTISPDGVHLAGDFQGWNPASTPMVDMGNNIYSATILLGASSYHEFKFVNGNTWEGAESVPAECGVDDGSGGYNRPVDLGTSNAVIPAICFSRCSACPPPPVPVNVTFRVNMSNDTVSPDGIHLVGDFQGWDTDSTAMTDTGNGIWAVILTLDGGSSHQYKFINGNSWEGEEIVPAECGVDNGTGGFNRLILLPQSDTVMEAVCFSSCDPCPLPPETSVVTFRVDMQDQLVSADGIHIAGNFQGWDPGSTPMVNLSGGIYEVSLLLAEGSDVQYKFINGLDWLNEEMVPEACGIDDGNGGFNRYMTVPVNDTSTAEVCFNECDICHVGWTELPSPGFMMDVPKPNPALSNVIFSLRAESPGTLLTRIYNSTGVEVLPAMQNNILAGFQEINMDINKLSPGIYTVKHLFSHGVISDRVIQRLIKQ